MSIPKIIHYCWFGNQPLPEDIQNYMESWKRQLPEYQIMEWNEKNIDLNANEFIRRAYEMKKYAFVSDYARLTALYRYGGIYFDIDIEVKKPLDEKLLENKAVFGFESDEKVMTAFMAAEKGHELIGCFLDSYKDKVFDPENMIPNTDLLTDLLKERGLHLNGISQNLEGIAVFSNEYFNAFNLKDFSYEITDKTYTVHHFYGSWCPKSKRLFFEFRKKLRALLGAGVYEKLKKIKKAIFG